MKKKHPFSLGVVRHFAGQKKYSHLTVAVVLVDLKGFSSQLSNSPPDCSPNRLTYCEPLGVCFEPLHIKTQPLNSDCFLVDLKGFEPSTFALRTRHSPS